MPGKDISGDIVNPTLTTDNSQISQQIYDSLRTGALAGLAKGIGTYAAKAAESASDTVDFSAPIGHISFDKGTMTPERQAEIDKARIKEGDPNEPGIKDKIKDMKGQILPLKEGDLTDPDLKEKLKGMHGYPQKEGDVTDSDLKERLKHMTGHPVKEGDPTDPDLKEELKHMHGYPVPEAHDSKK